MILKEPCTKLGISHPKDVPAQLTTIIRLIRIIWTNSPHYNTRERLTSLFRKLSNEIIRICCKSISLDAIFDGRVKSSIRNLIECIECCNKWKQIYRKTALSQHKYSSQGWVLDQSSIFAQIDAFVQRCKDLIEVCNCQIHFARWEDGEKTRMPILGGQRGPEVTRSLLEIEETFRKNLHNLMKAENAILDVKNTSWHEVFTRFRTAVKELEVMVQNLITSAFDTVKSVDDGVMLLKVFGHFKSREAIKRTIDKKTVDVMLILSDELNAVKKELWSKRSSKAFYDLPQHAGQAYQARLLRRRIDRSFKVVNDAKWLVKTGSGEEIKASYIQLTTALDEFIRKVFNEWALTVDRDSYKKLESPLMTRSELQKNLLDMNFDPYLLKLFSEIQFWEILMFEIPHYAADVYQRRDELRSLRENVLLVVRDYNRIIQDLDEDEIGLFRERIKVLDKKVQPGLSKLNWSNGTGSEYYITDCRAHASKVMQIVTGYKSGNQKIAKKCRSISEDLLVKINNKEVYEELDFYEDQLDHKDEVSKRLQFYYSDIVNEMSSQYNMFKRDWTGNADVYKHWVKYTERIDQFMEDAYRINVKYSLHEIFKAINGDGKSAPNPLFRINVILEEKKPDPTKKRHKNKNFYEVQFSPRLEKLQDVISNTMYKLTSAFRGIRRLPQILTKNAPESRSIAEVIDDDEETKKVRKLIMEGIERNNDQVKEWSTMWNQNYMEFWSINKDAFIEKYDTMNKDISSFDADLARYPETQNNVQKEEAIVMINFVLLDSNPIKLSISRHCQEWLDKFTGLLSRRATKRLTSIMSFMEENGAAVTTPPEDLDQLSDRIELYENLKASLEEKNRELPVIREHFLILEKYEVTVPMETLDLLDTMQEGYNKYAASVHEAEEMIKKSKDKFKSNLLSNADEFKKTVANNRDEYIRDGPFGTNTSPTDALQAIAQYFENCEALRMKEKSIRRGLSIFKIDQSENKELSELEEELQLLQSVWKIAENWDNLWNDWKVTKFADIVPDTLEQKAAVCFKDISKRQREAKDKDNWTIVKSTKDTIVRFQRTMPLVTDLKNPAMRDRHWLEIKEDIGTLFDHETDDFTLDKIIELKLDQHVDMISETSGAASKELAIEQALIDLEAAWSEIELEVGAYKDRGHFILKAPDEIFTQLEDNQVTLATMKASRFVKAFEKTVDYWERALSHIMETIEMILQVQRQWMYLENIFLGEDIRKQLPKESAEFDIINVDWKTLMTTLNGDKNARRGTHKDGLLEKLTTMNTKLEEIQKSLDMYLETKRQIFPRFYFLSNDDLLEILGQSKNPPAVQPHMNKCFDNIKALQMKPVAGAVNKLEAIGMESSEGEIVPFGSPVLLEGPVEAWLCDVERTMRWTLREILKNCKISLKKMITKREKWVKEWPGQMTITASQMQWTTSVEKGLMQAKERQDKKPMKSVKKKHIAFLKKFVESVRGSLSKNQRAKIVGLVTIEVHARDVIELLIKKGDFDENSFAWLQQLRLYWDRKIDDCIVRQTNTQFQYGYEYLGNSGRLAITPLTDRCYITLTTALHLHRGGSPKGPAGTGKTETTKDLGKALGMYVIVINCSEGLDFKSMGRMYSGLSQTGAWGCFDEFNRINIEVLSVVAQQILSILSALSAGQKRFIFEGREINLVWSCGIFITMNPGYAGRTELPDNLKSMFRPISMVVPDTALIADIILTGEGFDNARGLAKKVDVLYSLAVKQLSKQDHYDFGLRSMAALLRYAGKKKRANPKMNDDEVLLLAMRDMNVAKLTSGDLPLFNAITNDLFPGVDLPTLDYGQFKVQIEEELKKMNMQLSANAIGKVIQLYETKNSRHSTMIVGATQSGKTTTWKCLQNALSSLAKTGAEGYENVIEYPINPKSLSLGELYGEFDLATNEWADGVLSALMRKACSDDRPDQKWLIFDGPVDTLWIESMNSVMDDNKVLTLINGERISMPEQVSLLFELSSLAVASPATVSRCGMVYFDSADLGYEPYLKSWLSTKPKEFQPILSDLCTKYIDPLLEFKKINCKELVKVNETNAIQSLTRLFDTFANQENGVDSSDAENFPIMLQYWFVFSLIWSVAAGLTEESRKQVDTFLRELDGTFPNKDSIYEYWVDGKQFTWQNFEEKLEKSWRYSSSAPFYKIIVPTVDTVRYNLIVSSLLKNKNPVLLTGPVGTGKTSVAETVLESVSADFNQLTINMSAQTTSNNVQDIIEAKVEKRTKGVYVPVGGKNLICFLDDLNMPAKDTFGSQPPLELLRQWMDYSFWYDREKQVQREIRGMYVLGAMGPPGGGRSEISERTQSRFNLINMTFPSDEQITRIFGTMINQKLQSFDESVKPIGLTITKATLEVYQSVIERFLPTPAKIHYLFNLRDISKVFQGLLRANKDYHDTSTAMIRLWVHEIYRVFSDRLNNEKDSEAFHQLVNTKLGSLFDTTFHAICPSKTVPIFCDFMNPNAVFEDFEEVPKLKAYMEEQLEDYNLSPGVVSMDIVLFRDAIEHVCRIIRVIRQPRGNMFLVGIGGSGRQSLARLAAFICEFKTFQIEVSKHYRSNEFHEDLKRLYFQAGVENKPTCFLFTDTQVVEESFMEDINNILSSGQVPNLYRPEDMEEVVGALGPAAKKAGIPETAQEVFKFFIERVRNNLHVILCASPIGDAFRNRIRQYPGFVNCTTIDWFTEWPKDALLEVAERYLDGVDLGGEEIRKEAAIMFMLMHKSVSNASKRMLEELKRHNYVTPTNYLELVSGYKILLAEKREEIGSQVKKLRNGLFKIDDTREKVEKMSAELEIAKVKVAEFKKQCEEYLVTLVQQKKSADEQQKQVSATREKISQEEIKCKAIADNAQRDLDEATPALEAALVALESLNKKDITEIKSYSKPPPLVDTVLQAVMILRGAEPTWAEAKRHLGQGDFIQQLIDFEKDKMTDKTLKKVAQYCANSEFQPEIVGKVSSAAKSLCLWVRAMEVYGRIFRVIEPKRKRLNEATSLLAEKQAILADAEQKLNAVNELMNNLKMQYEEKLAEKVRLEKEAKITEEKLHRAGMLVDGLAGEKIRWTASAERLEESIAYLPGDCLIAAAFLSYMGPFLSNYRDEMVEKIWIKQIKERNIPCSPKFSFALFLSKPTTVRDWNLNGLPSDAFSTENGVIVTTGKRWPLMVDPQGQAIKWVKNMETKKGLKIIDLQQSDFLRTLENAIQFGTPVLLQNIQETLDPSLSPVLGKAYSKQGGRLVLKLGDKEIEWNPDFRFYITTKLSNPHYPPEISTKVSIINFAVKEQGLEAQLLGAVVRKERPDLEEQKDSLVVNIAHGKQKLQDLEDQILRLLNNAQGSLLDDVELVDTLQESKVTSNEVTQQLEDAEATEIKIDIAREGYRPSAKRASILFFVLNDMSTIDPMYQFSLDAYINLFNLSIDKSPKSPKVENRINNLNEYHTYAVYRYTCRGLFEKHKMLFSFQMCSKIMEAAGKLNMEEYNFFLRGGIVLDREGQMDNPCASWLPEQQWDNITELEKLTNFHGIMPSFEHYPRDWQKWYVSAAPESVEIPGEWDAQCNELQKMIILRSLRPDRVSFCAMSFIVNNLGAKFVEPPVLDMKAVFADSSAKTPLIFVLSPGVDPTTSLLSLAENSGMANRFHALSLGQGQAPIATRMIKEGVKEGNWVYLANCHLSLSWMPAMDKLIEQIIDGEPHPDFRLWLSSSPNKEFPIAVLQSGIKMTTEPPKGLKANMKRLYQNITPTQFERCQAQSKYKKLLFALCFFHSILLERKKFLMLGWNIIYGFNDSDFEVSENLLSIYLDEYDNTPWDALKYLIADVNYGGHVTDDWDRRLMQSYIYDYFTDEAIGKDYFKLSALDKYVIPKDGPLNTYVEYINMLPNTDHPEAFGQHPNADIASQITEARTLFETLISLQPKVVAAAGGQTREDKVMELANNVLNQLPEIIDYEGTQKILKDDPSPLNVVLLQEIQRYNSLLGIIKSSLIDLNKAIQGLVVMSSELEEAFTCIYETRVPPMWEFAYSSKKPLAAWTRDLVQRIEQFTKWAESAKQPHIFWLSGFTFPTGFLTAVLQYSARQSAIPVDSLSWEFSVFSVDESNIVNPPADGVYVKGLFLEGAGWDMKGAQLIEAAPMQLTTPVPVIHFKPTEAKKKSAKGMFACPTFYYPVRSTSFVVAVDLKSGLISFISCRHNCFQENTLPITGSSEEQLFSCHSTTKIINYIISVSNFYFLINKYIFKLTKRTALQNFYLCSVVTRD